MLNLLHGKWSNYKHNETKGESCGCLSQCQGLANNEPEQYVYIAKDKIYVDKEGKQQTSKEFNRLYIGDLEEFINSYPEQDRVFYECYQEGQYVKLFFDLDGDKSKFSPLFTQSVHFMLSNFRKTIAQLLCIELEDLSAITYSSSKGDKFSYHFHFGIYFKSILLMKQWIIRELIPELDKQIQLKSVFVDLTEMPTKLIDLNVYKSFGQLRLQGVKRLAQVDLKQKLKDTLRKVLRNIKSSY